MARVSGSRRSIAHRWFPHLVYVPERPFDEDAFLEDVRNAVACDGRAFVVVAEGLSASLPSPFDQVVYDRPISGGVAQSLAKLVERRLGYGARGEVLGLSSGAPHGQFPPLIATRRTRSAERDPACCTRV